jgi:hypothetical protein
VSKDYEQRLLFESLYTKLEHGIAIVQTSAQTLTIPPGWVHVMFCTTPCVTTEYMLATAKKFVQQLEHMDPCFARIGANNARDLASHLRVLLSDEHSAYKASAIVQLCRRWDVKYKAQIKERCDAIRNEKRRARTRPSSTQRW